VVIFLISDNIPSNFRLHVHGHLSIVGAMKRYIALSALFLTLCTRLFAAEDPVALAEKQEAEERYKRMNATLQELQDSVHAQQQTITKLNEELRSVRDELERVSRTTKEAVTQESFQRLVESVKEVDNNRKKDNEKVVTRLNESVKEIQKILAANKPVIPSHSQSVTKDPPANPNPGAGTNAGGSLKNNPPANPENGFEYVVQPNDSLGVLVTRLNKQGVKITKKQLMEANPEVKWDKLRIGQKLFIPKTT
jgi:TolA-binding protein